MHLGKPFLFIKKGKESQGLRAGREEVVVGLLRGVCV